MHPAELSAAPRTHVSSAGADGGSESPTLFSLLYMLGSDRFTTSEQRQQIRGVISDFLANEIPHSKVYLHLGQIVGHSVLHHAVSALKKHNPSEKFRTVGSDVLSSIYTNKEHEARTLSGSGLPLKFPTYDAAVARMLTAFSRILAFPLPHRGMAATFGHKIVRLENVLFFFPGWAPSRLADDELNPFSKIMVMYPQENFTTATFDCSGTLPPRGLHRYSLNVITARTREEGHQALIFGGSITEANQTIFSDKLYAFSFHCRKWTCVSPKEDLKAPMGARLPTARDSHASAVFPPSSTLDNAVSRSELLCIFGGRSGSIGMLNDLWMLDLSTITWNRLTMDPPTPRAGASLTWISASEMLLYGGETTSPQSGVIAHPLLLCASSLPSSSVVSADKQISHSTEFGWKWVQIEGQNDTNSLPRVAYGTLVQIEDMLFIVGGVTPDLPSTDSSLSLISVTVSKNRLRQTQEQSAGGTNTLPGIVSRNITGVHLFYSYPTEIISESCRQRLFAAACHFPLPNSSLPCIFVHGGSPTIPASDPNALAVSDTWVLSLSGEDPIFSRDSLPIPGNSIVEPRFSTRFDEQQRLAATTATAHQQHSFASELAQKSISSPYHTTPSLMWPLGNITTWSFAAIGQFLHNAAQTRVAAKNFDVSLMPLPKPLKNSTIGSKVLEGLTTVPGFSSHPQILKAPKSPNYMIVVSDNGEGLGYHALHRFLKRYGSLDSQEFPCVQPNLGKDAYGLGSKLALARLSHSALIFTRTASMVGVGLYSQRLMASCAAATMIAPVVFWRLSDMSIFDVGLSKLDYRHAQRLIMQYSPFDTPQSLADAMGAFGEENGTRIVLYDLRTDLSNINYCPNTGRLYNSWAPSNVTRQMVANIAPKQPKDNGQEDTTMTEDVVPGSNDFLSSVKKPQLDKSFPLWHSEEQSIDFSLDRYLSFFHLHGTQHLSVNRSELLFPKAPNVAPPAEDNYQNSLYRYMQHRLHCKVELNYLFDVQDSIYRSHAIFGFLNNPKQFPDNPVCETGVLLYHGERLITRLHLPFPSPRAGHSAAKSPYAKNHFSSYEGGSPFPLTALVNVPDWLLPRPSREDFVFERTAIMEEFTNKLEKLIKKYLNLCLDPMSLNSWAVSRDKKFEEFVQNTKSKKKARIGSLDNKDHHKAETTRTEGTKPILEGRTAQ
eukprot:GHVP01055163.1.p1 GENE.GHVP01055163.1~~GHVP01055163.1.p1  ORF type:complete len:1173 (+),score=208.23 GHVP01055163.1:948-4466(+)